MPIWFGASFLLVSASVSRNASSIPNTVDAFRPTLLVFSWRDIQIYAPVDGRGGNPLQHSFEIFYSRNPLRRVRGALGGLMLALAGLSGPEEVGVNQAREPQQALAQRQLAAGQVAPDGVDELGQAPEDALNEPAASRWRPEEVAHALDEGIHGSSPQEQAQALHAAGRLASAVRAGRRDLPVTGGRYPGRIVCLTEETTETLYLLGEEARIVGISGFTVRPPRARREKPRVSAFTSAKIDRILELEPDLVLGFSDLQADIAAELVRGDDPPTQ